MSDNQIQSNYIETDKKKYKYLWVLSDTLSILICKKYIIGPDWKNLVATLFLIIVPGIMIMSVTAVKKGFIVFLPLILFF